MNDNQLQLQSRSIIHVPFEVYNKNFTFIVNNEEFKTSHFISDILSPKISQIHKIDPTFDSFNIKTQSPGHFSYILNLIDYQIKSIPENEIPFISEVIQQLENDCITFTTTNKQEIITKDNVFTLLKTHLKCGLFYSTFITDEIDFISSHFFELCKTNKEDIMNLPEQVIERIFNNPKLRLEDEDQLLSIVNELYSNNSMHSYLYDFVHFSNLSVSAVVQFLDIFDSSHMTNNTWSRISDRLKIELKEIDQNKGERYVEQSKVKIFEYTQGNEFEGIMNYLTKETGGNIHDNGTIVISSNSIRNQSEHPKNLVDYNSSSQYYSLDNGDAVIVFNFKNRKIQLSEYSIKTNYENQNNCHLKNWSIDVSNDGEKWEEIDHHENDSALRGANLIKTFKIKRITNGFYSYIRLRQTGKTWNTYGNCNEIWFYFIEFFGKMKEPLQ